MANRLNENACSVYVTNNYLYISNVIKLWDLKNRKINLLLASWIGLKRKIIRKKWKCVCDFFLDMEKKEILFGRRVSAKKVRFYLGMIYFTWWFKMLFPVTDNRFLCMINGFLVENIRSKKVFDPRFHFWTFMKSTMDVNHCHGLLWLNDMNRLFVFDISKKSAMSFIRIESCFTTLEIII